MFREHLLREFAPYGALTKDQVDQLERHYSLLTQWNQKINLTRIRELEEVVKFHYCECLFLAKSLPASQFRVVDVGSGAGFPGIPIAILRPDCAVHLVESHQRKAVFLCEASRGLANVQVIAENADAVAPGYDWAVSRAVRLQEVLSFGLASNIALLTGEGEVGELKIPHNLTRLPWGKNRVVVTFHVEHGNIVKRG